MEKSDPSDPSDRSDWSAPPSRVSASANNKEPGGGWNPPPGRTCRCFRRLRPYQTTSPSGVAVSSGAEPSVVKRITPLESTKKPR